MPQAREGLPLGRTYNEEKRKKEKRNCATMMESLVIMLSFPLLFHALFLMRGGESTIFLLAFGPCFFFWLWRTCLAFQACYVTFFICAVPFIPEKNTEYVTLYIEEFFFICPFLRASLVSFLSLQPFIQLIFHVAVCSSVFC